MQTLKTTIKLFFLFILPLSLQGTTQLIAYPNQQKFSVTLAHSADASALTPNGRFLGVIAGNGTAISIVDTALFAVHATVSITGTPTGIVASGDSRFFYVTSTADDGVFQIELSDSTGAIPSAGLVATQLSGVDISDGFSDITISNNTLFLLSSGRTAIHLYDLTTHAILTTSGSPIALSFEAVEIRAEGLSDFLTVLGNDGQYALFTASGFSQIGATQDFSGLTSGGNNFTAVSLQTTTNGVLSFVANGIGGGEVFGMSLNSSSSPITLLDATASSVAINSIAVGNQPTAMLQTEDLLYVANNVDKTVAVIATGDYFNSSVSTVAPQTTFSVDAAPTRRGFVGFSDLDGYLYLSMGSSNSVAVITENPEITLTTPPASEITSSNFTLGFTSDQSGAYQIRLNSATAAAALDSDSGTLLQSGSATANQELLVTLETTQFDDGENLVTIFLTGDNGVGRAGAKVDIQLPPKAPEDFHLKFGDQKIYVNFRSLDSENTDFYRIYFGNSAAALTGTSNLNSPVVVDHPGADKGITEILSPLANGETVYVQVAAVNSLGIEGERSEMLAETPENTFGLLIATGETGGCSVLGTNESTATQAAGILIVWMVSAGLLLLQRLFYAKSFFRTLLLLLSIFICGLSTFSSRNVYAQDDELEATEEEHEEESTDDLEDDEFSPIHLSVAFGATWWFPKNDTTDQIYGGEGNEIFTLRLGLPWEIPSGVLQTAFEGGFLLEDRHLIGINSGRESGDESLLMLIPLRFDLLYLLDPPHSWWVAPFFATNYGWNYFKIEEKGVEVDGFRQSVRGRVGGRLYIDRIVRDPQGWRDVLSVTAAYLDIGGSYEIALSDSSFQTEGLLISAEVGVVF